MKKISWAYDRFVQIVWVLLFLSFVISLSFQMHPVEGILLAALYTGAAYPLSTYLTKNLLRDVTGKSNIAKFLLKFIVCTLLFAPVIPLSTILFRYLEQIGIFPTSIYFKYWDGSRYRFLDDFVGAFQAMAVINFGFCGMQFFVINLRIREELAKSRLTMLRAQINPHFMFNVLNHVHVLIKREPELADALLLKYTDILRYQLYSGDKETIPIGQEVQFLKNFIDVEAVRWKNKLDISCNWEVENPEMEIPPLLFITFVENAFKHVSRSDTEKGYVNISLLQKDKTVAFEVDNSNRDSVPSPKDNSGIGLVNIKRRLDILFPDKYSLEIEENDVFYSVKLTVNG